MRKVESSAVKAIGYNPFFVTVLFNHGMKYRYYGVPYKVYKALRMADSIGKAYNATIKGKYNSKRIGA